MWSAGEAGLEKVALNPQRCAGPAGRFFHPCGSAWCAPFWGDGSRLGSAWCGDGDGRAPHPGISTEGGIGRAGRHGPAAGTPVLVWVYCCVNQLPAAAGFAARCALAGVDRLQCDAFGLKDEIADHAHHIQANHKSPNAPGLLAVQLHWGVHSIHAVSRQAATLWIALQNGGRKTKP